MDSNALGTAMNSAPMGAAADRVLQRERVDHGEHQQAGEERHAEVGERDDRRGLGQVLVRGEDRTRT